MKFETFINTSDKPQEFHPLPWFCVEEINRSLYNEFENFVPGLNIIGCKKNNAIFAIH